MTSVQDQYGGQVCSAGSGEGASAHGIPPNEVFSVASPEPRSPRMPQPMSESVLQEHVAVVQSCLFQADPAHFSSQAIQRSFGVVYGLVTATIRRYLIAWDVVPCMREEDQQELTIIVLQRLASFHPRPENGSFRGWLKTVVSRHLARIERRRNSRKRPSINEAYNIEWIYYDPEEATAGERMEAAVQAALNAMEQRGHGDWAELVRLRYFEGWGSAVIAARKEIPLQKVTNDLRSARKLLRFLLNREYPYFGRIAGQSSSHTS